MTKQDIIEIWDLTIENPRSISSNVPYGIHRVELSTSICLDLKCNPNLNSTEMGDASIHCLGYSFELTNDEAFKMRYSFHQKFKALAADLKMIARSWKKA